MPHQRVDLNQSISHAITDIFEFEKKHGIGIEPKGGCISISSSAGPIAMSHPPPPPTSGFSLSLMRSVKPFYCHQLPCFGCNSLSECQQEENLSQYDGTVLHCAFCIKLIVY